MEATTFKLWHGRWQRQDAEWSAAAAVGDWRLRPLGEEELPTLGDSGSSDIGTKLVSMTKQAIGLVYVMVVKVREELSARVPLIPVDVDRFLTLAHYAGKSGSDRVIEVHKEGFEKFAAEWTKRSQALAGAPLWTICLACSVCHEPYVTGDPVLRFTHRTSKDRLSAHYLCGIVKANEVFPTCDGTNVFITASDKLAMTPELDAACDRATQLIAAKDEPGPISDEVFDRFRLAMTEHLTAIQSKTPYRQGVLAKDLRGLSEIVVLGVRAAAARAVTVRRTEERVGRNDACPCGSGEKFKKCCET